MKKRLLFLLLTVLMLLALTASAELTFPSAMKRIEASAFENDEALRGVLTLPSDIEKVGSRAFAGTSLHAIVLPEKCASVDGSVLADTDAAYLYLNSAATSVTGTLTGPVYVFGPAFGSVSSLDNFYAIETLVEADGFYYSVTDGASVPLCAVDGTKIAGEVTLPKLINGQPIRSLDTLVVSGCDKLEGLTVPAYLAEPEHLSVNTYPTMTATAPATTIPTANVGETLTWTTSVTGAYGNVTYIWSFETNGVTESLITTEPQVDYTLKTAGSCTASVSVMDEVGDSAGATAGAFPVNASDPVYRALLIGNTYPGTSQELKGSNTDVAGMRTMLSKMTGTPYRITTKSNLTSEQMVTAIQDTFASATANDISLFYFAGHGTNATSTSFHGALMGTGSTYLTVARLKTVLDQIPGKKVLIIDSCHSGQLIGKDGNPTPVTVEELNAFNSKVISIFSVMPRGANDLANSGYYVITAAHSTEQSVSSGYDSNKDGMLDKYFGVFTYSLCYGSGWNMATNVTRELSADTNADASITLYEAFAYARYKAQMTNPDQTAQIYPENSSLVVWAQ